MNIFDRLKDIEQNATPGKWGYETCHGVATVRSSDKVDVAHAVEYLTPDNATLITTARNLFKQLVAVAEAANVYRDKVDYTGGDSPQYFQDEQDKLDAALLALREKLKKP